MPGMTKIAILRERVRMAAWLARALVIASVAIAMAPSVRAENPSFGEMLARAQAQAAAGHRWAPPGDNMTETISSMMDIISSATPQQLAELSALLESDGSRLPPGVRPQGTLPVPHAAVVITKTDPNRTVPEPGVTMTEPDRPLPGPTEPKAESDRPVPGPPVTKMESDRPVSGPTLPETESDRAVASPAVTMTPPDRPAAGPDVTTKTEPDRPISGPTVTMTSPDRPVPGPAATVTPPDRAIPGRALTTTQPDRPVPGPAATVTPPDRAIPGRAVTMTQPDRPVPGPTATMTPPDRAIPGRAVTMTQPDRPVPGPAVTMIQPDRVVPKSVAPVSPPRSGARATELFERGQEAERLGDFSAARRFYTIAAQQGSAAAARNLGRLYDPIYLTQTALGGIDPDVAVARRWYERAVAMGDPIAGPLLEALASR
jgi:hypothetical protein